MGRWLRWGLGVLPGCRWQPWLAPAGGEAAGAIGGVSVAGWWRCGGQPTAVGQGREGRGPPSWVGSGAGVFSVGEGLASWMGAFSSFIFYIWHGNWPTPPACRAVSYRERNREVRGWKRAAGAAAAPEAEWREGQQGC